jgi:septum formation protein
MILASKSPRRKEILESMGFDLDIIVKEVEEVSEEKLPEDWAMDIAKKKALAVAYENQDKWVLGADTAVIFQGEFLGKPKDEKEAFEVLSRLSGKEHEVITGVSLINLKKNINVSFFESTKVYFKNIDSSEIMWYIGTKEPMDKAGSYGIQGKGAIFVDKIEGDFFNVMGFPISRFYDKLKELNVEELFKL